MQSMTMTMNMTMAINMTTSQGCTGREQSCHCDKINEIGKQMRQNKGQTRNGPKNRRLHACSYTSLTRRKTCEY